MRSVQGRGAKCVCVCIYGFKVGGGIPKPTNQQYRTDENANKL